ncbi:MAG: glycosyltransferase family A protein [Alistipes sp.]
MLDREEASQNLEYDFALDLIATFNHSAYLLRTLESLAGQTLPAQEFEILVVNNNSTDDTPAVFAEFARRHPELRLRMVAEPDQGISYARNRGVAEAEGECIVFIDDDEEAVPDFAKSYRDFFRSRPDCDAAGGAVVPVYEAPLPRWYSHYIEKMITGAMDMGDRVRPFRGSRYPGVGNSGFRRKLFERYGNFQHGARPLGLQSARRRGERLFHAYALAGHTLLLRAGGRDPSHHARIEAVGRVFRAADTDDRRQRADTNARRGNPLSRRRLLAEAVKWGGALVLATGYALRTGDQRIAT